MHRPASGIVAAAAAAAAAASHPDCCCSGGTDFDETRAPGSGLSGALVILGDAGTALILVGDAAGTVLISSGDVAISGDASSPDDASAPLLSAFPIFKIPTSGEGNLFDFFGISGARDTHSSRGSYAGELVAK